MLNFFAISPTKCPLKPTLANIYGALLKCDILFCCLHFFKINCNQILLKNLVVYHLNEAILLTFCCSLLIVEFFKLNKNILKDILLVTSLLFKLYRHCDWPTVFSGLNWFRTCCIRQLQVVTEVRRWRSLFTHIDRLMISWSKQCRKNNFRNLLQQQVTWREKKFYQFVKLHH